MHSNVMLNIKGCVFQWNVIKSERVHVNPDKVVGKALQKYLVWQVTSEVLFCSFCCYSVNITHAVWQRSLLSVPAWNTSRAAADDLQVKESLQHPFSCGFLPAPLFLILSDLSFPIPTFIFNSTAIILDLPNVGLVWQTEGSNVSFRGQGPVGVGCRGT